MGDKLIDWTDQDRQFSCIMWHQGSGVKKDVEGGKDSKDIV